MRFLGWWENKRSPESLANQCLFLWQEVDMSLDDFAIDRFKREHLLQYPRPSIAPLHLAKFHNLLSLHCLYNSA